MRPSEFSRAENWISVRRAWDSLKGLVRLAEAVMAQGIAKIFERFGDGMLVGGGRGRYEQGRVGGGAGVDLRREEGGGQSGAEKGGSRVRWVLGRDRGLRRGVQPEI
jgi:hypothetical protein